MRKIFPIFAVLFFGCIFSFAQARDVRQIKIISTWGGLGTPQKSELLITRKPKGYYAKGDRIENQKIDELLTAIDAPEIKGFQAANLGITQDWLEANAEPGIKEYAAYYFSTAALNQKELYLSTFKNLQTIEKILPGVLRGGWTDDYPSVTVEITEPDGSRSVLTSNAQPTFMLPWKIEKNGQPGQTYNADISRALVALLPKKFTNRERLSGEDLRRVLAAFIMRYIKPDWERLEAENKAGDTLSILKNDYEIISAEINPFHGVDFGESPDNKKNPQKSLHLILRKKDFPKNFAIRLKLPFKDEKIENLEDFRKNIGRYQDLILSIPWLRNYFENGRGAAELRFITARSFSEKAMKKFAEDMSKIGKHNLISEVEKEQNDIALVGIGGGLEYYQSYWLVLPDKRVILWRYRYPLLMNWSEKDFRTDECTDEISAGLKCVGAVISPAGTLTSD